ncbi:MULTISPECIES: LysE family translocator [Vibrio]|uniref:Threonine transporter RhtB n=2 Tax=Vibrio TaxID=662 RepID=A0A1E5CW71_9VIBR|nr:LysE family translocator [Vibrio genomosp. F6]OEE74391.1 threonine transporter RhtB [Vibrio genomosp. F6 str. FF-238]RBW65749.1 LysE family translocator [Vibrionales bacterium C3R12]
MFTVFISMALFALVGSISPGPVNVIATSTAANYGIKRAMPYVMGATISYTLIVFLAGILLESLTTFVPQISGGMRIVGGLFLIYMAIKIATAEPNVGSKEERLSAPSLFDGAISQGVNPKAWMVSMSGVSLYVIGQGSSGYYLSIFCLFSFVICFIGVSIWAVAGSVIGQYLQSQRRQVIFNWIMAMLLIGSVLSMWLAD